MVETVKFGGDFAFVRKNTAQSDAYAGPDGAISLDTESKNVRVHDDSTQGGAFTLPSLEGMGGWPIVRPSLDLKFSAKCIDPRLVVTRASTATYFDALGNIRTAAANEARIDYDPTTGECLGLLVEPAATNLLTYSDDLSNAAWVKTRVGLGTSIASPSGGLMQLVVPDTTLNTHLISTLSIDATAATKYTYSFLAKAGGYTHLRVRAVDDATGYLGALIFDLSTGTVIDIDSTLVYESKRIGKDVYLISISFTTTAPIGQSQGATKALCSCGITDANGASTFAGDGISGIYITSAQLELGGKATSRIKTTSTAATRAADVINMQGAGWLSSTEGTILVDVVVDYQATNVSQTFWTLDDGSQANRMRAHIVDDGADRLLVAVNNNVAVASLSDPGASNGWHRYVAAYKENDFAAVKNGGTVNVDTSGTPPTVTQLFIGSHRGTEDFMIGHIKRLAFWPKRLTNAELKRISL